MGAISARKTHLSVGHKDRLRIWTADQIPIGTVMKLGVRLRGSLYRSFAASKGERKTDQSVKGLNQFTLHRACPSSYCFCVGLLALCMTDCQAVPWSFGSLFKKHEVCGMLV